MIASSAIKDQNLCKKLHSLTEHDSEYWSFKNDSRREYGHGMFQYPAMMVPQLARAILNGVCAVHPEIKTVGDPFLGSGTVMTEAMFQGLNFFGTDINPLSILIAKVKKGPFFTSSLKGKIEDIKIRIYSDKSNEVSVYFQNIDKWFERNTQISLSKIHRSIKKEESLWARRFFWLCLADTVKYNNNSRTSTFKLHIRTNDDIEKRTAENNVIGYFMSVVERNFKIYKLQKEKLYNNGLIYKGKYTNNISLNIADIRDIGTLSKPCDLIITSPPYGDNATTVPYGQYSYLPLQWIDLKDIDSSIDNRCLDTTRSIDAASLGGSLKVGTSEINKLCELSSSFADYIHKIQDQPRDRLQRVSAFFRDLNNSLPPILSILTDNGLMAWTLGNRKVGKKRVPTDRILTELLEAHNVNYLCKLERKIPSKRMALKNSVAETISKETIVIMRKRA